MAGQVQQQVAVAFALCAFGVAATVGLMTSLGAPTALARCLVVLVAAYPIGRVLGAVLAVALNEHLTAMTAANPVPESLDLRANGGDGEVDVIDDVETV